VQLGGGVIQTQVIPRFEALHEPFRTITGQGNFAVGARFYIPSSDFVSFNIGVRNWVYLDKLEPWPARAQHWQRRPRRPL
jgi:hypothetical protein